MTSTATTLSGLRVLFFGMGGVFSRRPLEALLAAGADLCGVVTPAQPGLGLTYDHTPFTRLDSAARRPLRRALPLAGATQTSPSMLDLAAERSAPFLSVARLADPATLDALAALAPDAICIACFTRRLPAAVLALPRLGCLNAHPSLLPDNRGPDPLFWTFQAGASETGVTIHLMDADLDTGPILSLRRVTLVEGETESALEARLASLAGDLMVESLARLASGALTPTPQLRAGGNFHSWPTADDYTIPAAEWSARRAYIFACGVFGRDQPITLIAADRTRFRLIEPLSFDANAELGQPWNWESAERRVTLACAPGVFSCLAEPDRNGPASRDFPEALA